MLLFNVVKVCLNVPHYTKIKQNYTKQKLIQSKAGTELGDIGTSTSQLEQVLGVQRLTESAHFPA